MKKENDLLKQSIIAVNGGIGGGAENADNNKKEIEKNIIEHGLLRYKKINSEILLPVCNPDEAYISCERGWRYFRGIREYHEGVDIVSKYDLRIVSSQNGTLRHGYNRIYGNYIIIDNGRIQTRYSHLSKIMKEDGTVKQGEIIGIMGMSGKANGVHLDWEYYENWETKNIFSNSTWKKGVEL